MPRPLLALLVSLFAATPSFAGETWDYDAGSNPRAYIDEAQFRLHVPLGVASLRGTLVLIPGCNQDGRALVNDPAWRALAAETHFALMACNFTEAEGRYQMDINGSVSQTLEKAIAALAKISRHHELVAAPIALWGHSAGANLSMGYSHYAPAKVVAAATTKATTGPMPRPFGNARVPILLTTGGKEKPEWLRANVEGFKQGRRSGSPWALAVGKQEAHELGATMDVIVPFLKGVILLRTGPPPKIAPSPLTTATLPPVLKPIASKTGWLGNPETHEIAPATTYPGSKTDAVWLPDETTARAWKAYLQ